MSSLREMLANRKDDESSQGSQENLDKGNKFKCPECGGEEILLIETDLMARTWFTIEDGQVIESDPKYEACDNYWISYECANRNCEYELPVNRFDDDKFDDLGVCCSTLHIMGTA